MQLQKSLVAFEEVSTVVFSQIMHSLLIFFHIFRILWMVPIYGVDAVSIHISFSFKNDKYFRK